MSLLDRIAPTRTDKPPRVVVHGPEKVGKSTFAAGAPSPVFVPTEDGLAGIEAMAFPLSTDYGQFVRYLVELHESPHDYRTVVVDSADWLERLIHDDVCKRDGAANIEKAHGGYGKGYLVALNQWRQVLGWLDALNRDRGMAVVLICHSRVVTINDPLHDPYDCYMMKLHSPRNGNAGSRELLKEWADILLFADTRKFSRTIEVTEKQKLGRATSSGERVLYTQPSPAYAAGSRYPLPPELPLTWQALADALNPEESETKGETK